MIITLCGQMHNTRGFRFESIEPLDITFNSSKLEREIYLLLLDGHPRTTRYIREQLLQRRNWLSKKFLFTYNVSDACYSLWHKHKVAIYNNSLNLPRDQQAWVIK